MRNMTQTVQIAVFVILLSLFLPGAPVCGDSRAADDPVLAQTDNGQETAERQRLAILAMRDKTLSALAVLKPETKEVLEKAEGYAVFDATGIYVLLYVGIAGRGVLIDNAGGEVTYMTMARAGTGPGVGYQKFRAVIVFKNRKLLEQFKTAGGDIGAAGHLVVKGFGTGGSVGGEVSFDPLLDLYQITDHGLAAEASWGATAFAPDHSLNDGRP
jgi:lipid-binding SYLF domain-containing protein